MVTRATDLKDWHAGRMLFALARHFDWWSTKMITEFEIDGGRADLLLISKAGYATEIEIKISAKDWRIDQSKKEIQGRPSAHQPPVLRSARAAIGQTRYPQYQVDKAACRDTQYRWRRHRSRYGTRAPSGQAI